MTFLRWTLRDMTTEDVFTLGVNPNKMTSPFAQHDTTLWSVSRINNARRAWRKPFTPYEWTFSGVVLDELDYAQRKQLSERAAKYELTDHFGRTMVVRIITFKPTQKAPKSLLYPWRHDYDMSCLVYTQPTRFGEL